MRSLLAAWRFLTRIPLPGPATRAEDLAGAVGWFPLVGAAVGAAIAGAFAALARVLPEPVAAVLAVVFGLLLTGGFHEDGLSDAVDGLGGGWSSDQSLAIMKDSRIGAYGSMALVAALALRGACLLGLGERALWAFPLAMAWGRGAISVVLRLLPPIAEGLAKEVHRRAGWGPPLLAWTLCLLAGGLAWRLGAPRLLPAAGAALALTLAWTLYLKRRMGGHSGDLLGATAMLAEAAALLVWVAR